jgi:hypothetical protein
VQGQFAHQGVGHPDAARRLLGEGAVEQAAVLLRGLAVIEQPTFAHVGLFQRLHQFADEHRLELACHLTQLRLVYNFNTRVLVRAIVQHFDLAQNQALFDQPVESKIEELFTQFSSPTS